MNIATPLQALWISLVITAIYPVAGKFAVPYISPSLLLIFSAFIAALFYAPWVIKTGLWRKFKQKEIVLSLALIGLLGTALPFLCMFIALIYTTPANAAIMNQAEVVYSLVLAAVFLKERPTAKQLLGTALVITGVVIVLLSGGFEARWKGDLIVLCSVWMFQASHVFVKKLPADLPPQFITFGRAVFACLWSIPIAAALTVLPFGVKVLFIEPSWQLLLLLFYMGVINYGLSNAFWYKAMRNMDLSKATAVMLSYPALTYLFSVVMGTDKISLPQTAGLVLAFAGAYLVTHIIKNHKKGKLQDEISFI